LAAELGSEQVTKEPTEALEPEISTNPFGDFFEEEVVFDGASPMGTGSLNKSSQTYGNGRDSADRNSPSNPNLANEELGKSLFSENQISTDEMGVENLPSFEYGLPFDQAETIGNDQPFDPAADPVFPEPLAEFIAEDLAEPIWEYKSESQLCANLPESADALNIDITETNINDAPFIEPIVAAANVGAFQWPPVDDIATRELSAQSASSGPPVSAKVTPARVRMVPKDDRDLLVLEDDVADYGSGSQSPAGNTRRQEYRQLFAKLRRS
jgi:hypothetical protein